MIKQLKSALSLPARELALIVMVALAIAIGIAFFAARTPGGSARATAQHSGVERPPPPPTAQPDTETIRTPEHEEHQR